MGGACVFVLEKCNLEKGGNKQKRNMGGVSVLVQEKCNLEKGGNEQKRNMGGAWFPSREIQTLQRRKRANCEYGCLMYWTPTLFHCHPYSRFSCAQRVIQINSTLNPPEDLHAFTQHIPLECKYAYFPAYNFGVHCWQAPMQYLLILLLLLLHRWSAG